MVMSHKEAFGIIEKYHRENSYPPVDVVELARRFGVKEINKFSGAGAIDPESLSSIIDSIKITLNQMEAKYKSNRVSGYVRRVDKDNENEGYIIGVNQDDAKVRQRFSISHEIAHIVLHSALIGDGIKDMINKKIGSDDSKNGVDKNEENYSLYRSGLSNSVETSANDLAARILMPLKFIEEAIKSGVKDIPALAELFGVSEQAMTIRVKKL